MTGPDDEEGGQGHEFGEAVPASSGRPKPGDIITESGLAMAPGPLVGHDVSTPLEEDEPEHTIPPAPLWAMKERRHTQWHLLAAHEQHDRIRECLEADVKYVRGIPANPTLRSNESTKMAKAERVAILFGLLIDLDCA